jgi:hypothetical protein
MSCEIGMSNPQKTAFLTDLEICRLVDRLIAEGSMPESAAGALYYFLQDEVLRDRLMRRLKSRL